jgi:hypothetical protein
MARVGAESPRHLGERVPRRPVVPDPWLARKPAADPSDMDLDDQRQEGAGGVQIVAPSSIRTTLSSRSFARRNGLLAGRLVPPGAPGDFNQVRCGQDLVEPRPHTLEHRRWSWPRPPAPARPASANTPLPQISALVLPIRAGEQVIG